jgi:hypothetical protein
VRKIVIAPLLALALTIPAAGSALATGAGVADISRGGHSASESSKGGSVKTGPAKGGKADRHSKPKRVRFVGIGTVTSVDPEANTVSLTFRKGSSKGLRGRTVDVSVTASTRIRRNGPLAKLGDIVAGDRVKIEGVRIASTYVAIHVKAKGVKAAKPVDDGTVPTPAPTPSPDPTPTPTPDPTVTPTPDPTVTPTPTPDPSSTI